jgi:hypothetical protein
VLTRTFPAKSATAQTKAFCFFFSKKKALPCFLWVNLQGGWYKLQILDPGDSGSTSSGLMKFWCVILEPALA